MSTWSLQWRWNSHQSKALVSGDICICTVMHCKYAFWAWGFSCKKCQFNVNWDVKIGGVSLWCNYIMWGGAMGGGWLAPGRDGLAAELKDLQFSQPEHRVTLAKDKGRKSIHCYWKFSNQQLQFKMWQPSGDLNPYTSEWLWHCCCVLLLYLRRSSSHWSTRHDQSLPRRAGPPFICLVNKANLSGRCLRIKFIWTSFSARSSRPALLQAAASQQKVFSSLGFLIFGRNSKSIFRF